jgi:hypothetical protein
VKQTVIPLEGIFSPTNLTNHRTLLVFSFLVIRIPGDGRSPETRQF